MFDSDFPMKTREYNSRIAVRLSSEHREQIDRLIKTRGFKNLSQIVRAALTEFLEKTLELG